ncbi:nucleotide disphospho-sugar-binding domain-containing protein [Streptomyces calidiresistens]|nr:nucleotide disphospho-sugar-binding domain-containing protein [Streptomyces calidiresistens]
MLMVPTAWALRAAGHDVRIASQPNLMGVVSESGLTGIPVGAELAISGRHLVGGHRAGSRLPYDIGEDHPEKLTPRHVRTTLAMYPRGISELVADRRMLDDLVAVAREWRPDLVIWDAMTYTGPIAARACGAAHVRSLFGPDHLARMRRLFLELHPDPGPHGDPLRAWLGDRLRHLADPAAAVPGVESDSAPGSGNEVGFEEELVLGRATIDPMHPALRVTGDTTYLPTRFIPYGGRMTVPHSLPVPSRRPLICVTLGTSARDLGLPTPPLDRLLRAAADTGAGVIATAPPGVIADLGPLPEHVRVVEHIPLDAVLPHCAAVVHHFGAGTLHTALVHGVPQLRVSDGVNLWGEPEMARRLVARGAALDAAEELTPGALTDDLTRLLEDPSFATNAAVLREEALAQPTPHDLVPALEDLARTRDRVPGAVPIPPPRTARTTPPR